MMNEMRLKLWVAVAIALVLVTYACFYTRPVMYHFTQQPNVAFITSIFGNYEQSCKPFMSQTIPSDFICFTDNPDLIANGWSIDTHPYHDAFPNPQDTGYNHNSLKNNRHTFNIAKYYKQSFQHVPRMADYDIVIWLDGTLEITSPNVAEYAARIFEDTASHLIAFQHDLRPDGLLKDEVAASHFERYTSTHWNGQDQPYQDVDAQYQAYIDNGFQEGRCVWITCFVAMDMRKEGTHRFLDAWYLETLNRTTQDQISFPFAKDIAGVILHSLPDEHIRGKPSSFTDFYVKHEHGK
jgi:hypothetical protein